MMLEAVNDQCGKVLAALSGVIVGKDAVLRKILEGLLADGHILIEDYPGLAKTLIARLLGEVLDLKFKRIQFTPDLLPSDITGSFLYDQKESRFEFRRGPIFANLLLADEINRATPKTQSALLEAMQENQVTVEGEAFRLDRPFLVVATQNPIELEGTYPLPEAQLDRFIMRVSVGYPNPEEEQEILRRRRQRSDEVVHLSHIVSREMLVSMQRALEKVFVGDAVERYMVDVTRVTREDKRVALGASPRGTLALMRLSRAEAVLSGRDFVTPDDVKAMAIPALAHRLVLKPEFWVTRVSTVAVVEDVLSRVSTPPTDVA